MAENEHKFNHETNTCIYCGIYFKRKPQAEIDSQIRPGRNIVHIEDVFDKHENKIEFSLKCFPAKT
jgi:hypothetical protein